MKTKKIISIMFILLLLITTVSAADLGTLSYWYATYTGASTSKIGRWTSTPYVWSAPMDSTFTSADFASYVDHALMQWDSAGISTYGVDNELDAPLRIYGGSLATLQGLDPAFPSASAGRTVTAAIQEGTWTYQGTTKTGYEIVEADVYIRSVSGKTTSGYKNTTTHELGHSLGWLGESTNTSDVMYYTESSVTTLTTRDKSHLTQVY